ncbi:glycosyl transferase family 1 [Capsulimonas corticalis]|uniref:Glycosyl transferase family 1 n=1 Tax=Capsulimonas corticalis TaxID=2219043 RepID=A0A402CXT4_9BACT|nr:glycosyltransferase family 4 protein [Capsulimonas corticalis]BDI32151.1 glycosyl transferase family 1 [Capsulimonas corticalis]
MPTVNSSDMHERASRQSRKTVKPPAAPRVLYVATSSGEGGIERHSIRLAERLRDRDVTVGYCCAPNTFLSQTCGECGIPAYPLVSRNSGDPAAIVRLASIIRRERPDVVHVHSRRDYVPALLAAGLVRGGSRSGRKPHLLIHSHLDKPLGEPHALSGWFFQKTASRVIAVSAAVQQRLLQLHNLPDSFVPIIHNGIDLGAFTTPNTLMHGLRRAGARLTWRIESKAMVIGMVGRLYAKGQEMMVAALPALLKKHPSLHLVLVGPEGDAGDKQRLKGLIAEAGVTDKVTIAGRREDIPELLPAFDLLVHLPKTESFGLALVEAMATGLPVIASNIGGCAEVVRDDQSGYLIPHGDMTALSEAITRLISGPHAAALRTRLGQRGHDIAWECFSIEQQVDRLEELYTALVQFPGSR